MTAECPFCEYEGSTRSVEAHISGCSDEQHQGRVGGHWRSTIESSHDPPEEAAIPTPTRSAALVVVAVVAVGMFWMYRTRPTSTGSEEEDTEEVGVLARP